MKRLKSSNYLDDLGLYEPAFVLFVILVIYGVTCILQPRTKRQILWWGVALICIIGSVGAASELLRTGTISAPASQN